MKKHQYKSIYLFVVSESHTHTTKIKRIRWSEEENELFRKSFSLHIARKEMPTGKELKDLSKKLPARTIAQLRTKIHNIISGKLKKF